MDKEKGRSVYAKLNTTERNESLGEWASRSLGISGINTLAKTTCQRVCGRNGPRTRQIRQDRLQHDIVSHLCALEREDISLLHISKYYI